MVFLEYPALVTEGCLISVSRRGAGSGGRGGASEMRRQKPPGGPSRACSRRASRTPRALTAGRPAIQSAHRRPSAWPSTVECHGPITGLQRDERIDHRGRRGANLQTPRAGRLGTWRTWRTCGILDFDKPRCREASRSVGLPGPLASRAPSVHFEDGRTGLRPTRGRKEYGRRSVGLLNPSPERGGSGAKRRGWGYA